MVLVFGTPVKVVLFFSPMPLYQDCDMPEGLKAPETRLEAGVDQVDVMNFLGLKRAESLSVSSDSPDDSDEDASPQI